MVLLGKRSAGAAQTAHGFRREFWLYSLLYLIFFSIIFLPVICRNGLILAGDGYGMYYPVLVNFRRSLLEAADSIRSGSFRLQMMNFNYGFGTDNPTALTAYLAFPLFWLSALLPEAWLPQLLTAIIFLLDYLAGVAFLRLCSHFGIRSDWNALMALAYTFSSCFMNYYMFNPHFMYMLAAFPLMVIGIDRVIQKKGWRLLCVCTFWLSFASFTMLVYTLPFLALFALIHVWFLYKKDHFFLNLWKALLRCLPALIIGFLLSGVFQLPMLNLLKNSARGVGGDQLNLANLLIPDLNRMSECFFLIEPNEYQIPLYVTPMFIAIPGMLLTLLVLRKHRELRVCLLAMIACVSVPLIDYGINGFQYALIRWGCAPALLFSVAGAVGMAEFPQLDRRQYRRAVCLFCIYGISFSSLFFQKYAACEYCAACFSAAALLRLFPPLGRLWNRFVSAAEKKVQQFIALLKENRPSVPHYLALAGLILIVIGSLLAVIVLALLPEYTFYPQIPCGVGVTALAALFILRKPKWASVCTKVLAVCFFGFSVTLFFSFHKSKYADISTVRLYQMIQEEPVPENSFGRVLTVLSGGESDEENTDEDEEDEEDEETQTLTSEMKTGIPPMFVQYQIDSPHLSNYSLLYDVPDVIFFHNMMSADYLDLARRSGLTGNASSAFTCIFDFDQRAEFHTLFGVRTIGTNDPEFSGFGLREIRSEAGDDGEINRLYEYEYALPAGVTYDTYMSEETYQSLQGVVLPYAMLQAAYCEKPDGSSVSAVSEQMLPDYRCDVQVQKDYVKTNSLGMEVYHYTITPNQDVTDCFLYIEADNAAVRYPTKFSGKTIIITVDDEKEQYFGVMNSNSVWPWTRRTDRYVFPLGYREAPVEKIEFDFQMECDALDVYAIPSSVLTDAYADRCAETLQNVQITENQLDGDITVSSDKLLSVSLICNDGWRVFVDGEEAPLCKVNGIFLGVQLAAGTHHVRFVYRTPWMTGGIICTFAGLLLWILIEIFFRKKKAQAGQNAGNVQNGQAS